MTRSKNNITQTFKETYEALLGQLNDPAVFQLYAEMTMKHVMVTRELNRVHNKQESQEKNLKTVMARLQKMAIVNNENFFQNIRFITTSFGNKSSLKSFFKDGLTPKGFKSPLTSPEAFYDVGFDLVYTGEESSLTPMPALNINFKPLIQLISRANFDSVSPEEIKT